MRLSLPFPIKPYGVTQRWGNVPVDANGVPIYKRFGFTKHNGEDVLLGKDNKVRAELPGIITKIAWQPEGGGLYLTVLYDGTYDFDDGKQAQVKMSFLHLKQVLVGTGDRVVVGQPLAIQDNTGFSTGPHTHCEPNRVIADGAGGYIYIDIGNDADASFDPAPYRNGQFAEDIYTISILQQMVVLYNKVLDLMKIKPK